jgi:hypothetical protein
MSFLLRRVAKLEGRFPTVVEPDPTRGFQLAALEKLPMCDLELLRAMLLRNDQAIPENEAEESAIQHCNEALAATAAEWKLPPTGSRAKEKRV